MIQSQYAVASKNRPQSHARAHPQRVQQEVFTPEILARMEVHLRRHLIADAAGSTDWHEPESTLDDLFNRAGEQLASRDSRERFADVCNTLIGSIGADVLMPHKPSILGVIGTGEVAEAQITAAFAHRQFDTLRIYGRKPVAANLMAKKFRHHTKKPVEVVVTPEEAVIQADVIILAASRTRPEIDPDWIMQGAHITCATPQTLNMHELPLEMIARSKIIASDCPQHIGATNDHLIDASYATRRVIHLGAMIDRFDPDRSRGTTLLFMTGAKEMTAPVLKAFAHAQVSK